MATQGTFYLDAPSFGSATVVYSDAALTTVAADGFYSDGTIVREQSSGALLPQVTCPSCTNEFLVGFGATSDDACGFIDSGTVVGDNANFCDCTTFTGAIFAAAATGNYFISFGGYVLQVSVVNTNPEATVIGACTTCATYYVVEGCGVSDISDNNACDDALTNPKTLYSDCSPVAIGCGLYWDMALTSPVLQLYVFAESNWNMDGGGLITGLSTNQC